MSEKKYTTTETGPRIAAFLDATIRNAGFALKYAISEGDDPHPDFENPELTVRFSGGDVELLLENRAELLLAFEQLSMEVLRMPSEDHSLLRFDANEYRVLRIEELRLSALTVAETVKRSKMPFRFNPMNSRERRIIHLALRNEPTLHSESAGMGPGRHVVVVPAGMAIPPEPPRPPRPMERSGDRHGSGRPGGSGPSGGRSGDRPRGRR